LIEGDACRNLEKVEQLISKEESVLIIDDSSHTHDNTLNVLRLYSKLIKPGDYFIVEDSICYHGLELGPKPGPYEAIETFTKENADFEIDRSREHFLITWNPKGYLKRITLAVERPLMRHPGSASQTKTNVSSLKRVLKLFIPPILILIMKRLLNRH